MSTKSNNEEAPTAGEVQSLTEVDIVNIYHAWSEVSTTPLYLGARDVLAGVAGGRDELLSDSDLIPLDSAAQSIEGVHNYAVKSSARWAHLANKYVSALSQEQYDALTHGWKAHKRVES